jgi:hypothetical protein
LVEVPVVALGAVWVALASRRLPTLATPFLPLLGEIVQCAEILLNEIPPLAAITIRKAGQDRAYNFVLR